MTDDDTQNGSSTDQNSTTGLLGPLTLSGVGASLKRFLGAGRRNESAQSDGGQSGTDEFRRASDPSDQTPSEVEDDEWGPMWTIDEDSEEMERRREVWNTDAEDRERVEEVNENNRMAAAENTDHETADAFNPDEVGAEEAESNLKEWIRRNSGN